MRKKLLSFAHDVEQYDYLPEQAIAAGAVTVRIKLKPHIFRYPTLLANNLSLCVCSGCNFSWEIFDYLRANGSLSEKNLSYLKISLAISIYLRTKAYISMKTTPKDVSLCSPRVHVDGNIYHMPVNLFIILGCILVPTKSLLSINSVNAFKP